MMLARKRLLSAAVTRSATTTTTTRSSLPKVVSSATSLEARADAERHHQTTLATTAVAPRFTTTTFGTSYRSYSTTRPVLDKDDDDDDKDKKDTTSTSSSSATAKEETESRYETINNPGLSDEEIDAIFAEEEARLEAIEKAKFVPNWKPGMRKRPLKFSYSLEEFQYELEPELFDKDQPRWTLRDRRCGALAIKVGMMPLYDDQWGVRYPCTVLFLDSNVVLGHKTMDKHGYAAVRVAAGQRKRKNVGKSVLGQYQEILDNDKKENPPYLIREFRVSDERHLPPLHSRIHARHFVPGQNVDVSGISKGKGFQGAMKRHNFGGMPASHGVSKSHRALGSTGQCQDPGRVFKGKKMAGRMGTDRVTVQNLRVLKIDRGRNLLYVQGAVPGNNGNFVEIRDAVKKPLWKTDKVQDKVDRPPLPTFEYDDAIDGCGEAGHEVWMPSPLIDPLDPELEENQEAA